MIGGTEIMLIILIIAVVFGATKLPQLAKSLGRAKGEFEKAKLEMQREMEEAKKPTKEAVRDGQ